MDSSILRVQKKTSPPVAQTCRTRLIVSNAIGLHARSASVIVKTLQKYDSVIVMTYGDKSANAKSIMGILALCAGKGAEVEITADGHDAGEAVRTIEYLFACSFHENESEAEKFFREP